ncbi:hypothetical protein F7Q99_39140 [Streptomyces kaniharaensis]|uniref:Uncharacterized protein n=1 Tax=Streptomyces kaniharaensis TaxID=212423 RepID=A0A6N7L5L4_9ACTN|nr:hypothetical protein [Streptomyces kaniharaensis]MQS18048.1 hypothetical protein [Streptomyces kaniharaensis]
MLSRTEKTTETTDNDTAEYGDDCCSTKRIGLAALGGMPLMVGAAGPSTAPSAPASPAPRCPGPSVGDSLNLLGHFVDALPGHWFTAVGLAVGGLGYGYMHLKKQVTEGNARALPLPKGTGFATDREVNETLGERQLLNRVADLRPSLVGSGVRPTALDLGTQLGTDAIWKKQCTSPVRTRS